MRSSVTKTSDCTPSLPPTSNRAASGRVWRRTELWSTAPPQPRIQSTCAPTPGGDASLTRNRGGRVRLPSSRRRRNMYWSPGGAAELYTTLRGAHRRHTPFSTRRPLRGGAAVARARDCTSQALPAHCGDAGHPAATGVVGNGVGGSPKGFRSNSMRPVQAVEARWG